MGRTINVNVTKERPIEVDISFSKNGYVPSGGHEGQVLSVRDSEYSWKDNPINIKDDEELNEYTAKNKGKKYAVKHLKGLGEMSADETEVLTNPDKRIIKQITVKDIEETNNLFNDLMGTLIAPRKAYIQAHSKEARYGI